MSSPARSDAPLGVALVLSVAFVLGLIYLLSVPTQVSAQQSDFGPFAREWGAHGIGLTIAPNGQGKASWRVYQWCDDDPTPPCDRIENAEIHSGGQATFQLQRVEGDTAFGIVTATTDPTVLERGPFKLHLMPYGMAQIDQGPFPIDLCGPDFFDLAPAEVIEAMPCGA